MEFIKAGIEDIKVLREIAHSSEAYWGYDKAFMDIFDEKVNITKEFISENPVFAGISNDNIVCFWGAIPQGAHCKLEYFYIADSRINTGVGRIMWQHFISRCCTNNIIEVSFVTVPQAVGFYQKMGARLTGEELSSIDNRPIPSFGYKI